MNANRTSSFRPLAVRNRRGITLLFVISMIVLFLLMGTTFVVVSNDYLRASRRRNIAAPAGGAAVSRVSGQRLVEQAFLEVVRGTSLDNENSPLRAHDLLGDMYGYGIKARLNPAATPPFAPDVHDSEHFLTFSIRVNNAGAPPLNATSLLSGETLQSLMTHDETITAAPSIPPGHFNGRLITITTGEAKGLICRVMQSEGTSAGLGDETHSFVVYPLNPKAGLENVKDALVDELSSGASVEAVINGRAFAGTGAGLYDPTKPIDQAALGGSASEPDKLLNKRLTGAGGLLTDYLGQVAGGSTEPNPRATNEPWDAVDEQNIFLAGILDRSAGGGTAGELEEDEITPSFFRSGSVTGFDAFDGAGSGSGKQVDNDNDGISDGIWIDTGMPIQSTPDGGFIKPLVSYLILDMDGRLNINAHGSRAAGTVDTTNVLGGGTPELVTGMGFGPAEISLATVLPGIASGVPVATQVARQRYEPLRGDNNVANHQPGVAGEIDGRSRYRLAGYPDGTTGRLFGSPYDLLGRTTLAFATNPAAAGVAPPELEALLPSLLDLTGAAPTMDDQLEDSPYEVDLLSSGDSSDRLYKVSELEAVLRPADRDSVLLDDRFTDDNGGTPTGLAAYFADPSSPPVGVTLTEPQIDFLRKLITTHSYEVPAIPEDVNQLLYNALTVPEDQRADLMGQLLSPEVRRGLPMNLNRLFGNGLDDDGDGIIDEPGESEDELVGIGDDDINLDVNNDGVDDSGQSQASLQARQNFARRMFVMLILLTENPSRDGDLSDATGFYDFDGSGSVEEEDLAMHRRMLAQWCVNIVDFRDVDSVMTGMEFDLNPFDGWGVSMTVGGKTTWELDGDLTTTENLGNFAGTIGNYFVAWGVERPELLVTETTAFHDTRTEDLNSGGGQVGAGDMGNNLDSSLVPNASAFIELYNPWLGATTPPELSGGAGGGVSLTLTSPTGSTPDQESPVWRLAVVDRTATEIDDPDFETNLSAADIKRYVYFATPGTALAGADFVGEKIFVPVATPTSAAVAPGGYAVVGSAGVSDGAGNYTTYLGRLNDAEVMALTQPEDAETMTQRLVLSPMAGEFSWYDATAGMLQTESGIVAIPVGQDLAPAAGPPVIRPFGISDPDAGYAGGDPTTLLPLDTVADGLNDGFRFTITRPDPVDDGNANLPASSGGFVNAHRIVLLQRLANPLEPFNLQSNPYRTIDSHAVDLHVFNGIDESGNAPATDNIKLGSWERSEAATPTPNEAPVLLWRASILRDAEPDDSQMLPTHVLQRAFDKQTFGKINDYYVTNAGGNAFPWLTWNNRPFANRFELTNVPYTSSYWLTRLFGVRDGTAGDTYSAANHSSVASIATSDDLKKTIHPNAASFPHLLNFEADSAESDRLQQVFDFVEVPSRFAGVNQYVNLSATNTNADELRNAAAEETFGYRLSAPFDELSSYRYPGKVNLNTIPAAEIWNALLGATEQSMPGMTDKAGPYASQLTFDAWRGATDDSPMRPAVAANYVADGDTVPGLANTGLFRSQDGEREAGDGAGGEEDYFAAYRETANAFNNTDRNSYFRNGIRQRLGSIATNRSSVFAIWVTVGYFEWDPETNDLRDQTMGGIEYGTDTGEVIRSRGFFLFDRSIPMAYEPGENHNVDRGILLQSFVE